MQILRTSGTDWRDRTLISKLYVDQSVKLMYDGKSSDKDEEKNVSSYRMTVTRREETGNCKQQISLCGELGLE